MGLCDDGKTCPRVFVEDGGEVVFQGYLVDDSTRPDLSAPPAGETQVRMPWEKAVELCRWVLGHGAARAMAAGGQWEPPDVLDDVTDSLFRLEVQQRYTVASEEAKIAAWREGKPIPRPDPASNAWYRRVQDSVRAGQRWQRVHVVDQPLSEYLRYELESYLGSAELGYETFIADRSKHPELAAVTNDYYLLDGDTDRAVVVLMGYDADGRPLQLWRTADAPVVADARRKRDLALACAVPLHEFLAGLPTGIRG